MGVSITFTPLYGARTPHHALCYLLTIDNFRILLDCGWTSAFSPSHLAALARLAPQVDVVLLSHPDLAHLGALPYAVAHLGLKATVFSTLPVWRMGQMFMYDAYLSRDAQAPFHVFDLDHVDAAFEISASPDGKDPRYRLLKYQQHFPLDAFPNGQGIVITPHAAGHMLGGTVWNIRKNTEDIVYAVDFNHRRERHLNPTTLATFSRPSHLIVGASQALTHTETKKASDLFNKAKATVLGGGNVLIPVDTAGRIIELAVQLHDAWAVDRDVAHVPLVILHDLSARTFEFARSMIEWMSDEVVKRFDISRENLFIFQHVKLCQSLKALDGLASPMVVLASSISMELGFARQLFARWCQKPQNAIILVDRPEPDTLYSKLFEYCKKSSDSAAEGRGDTHAAEPLPLSLVLQRKESLHGEELEKWREGERARISREEEEARKEMEAAKLASEAAEREKEVAVANAEEPSDAKDTQVTPKTGELVTLDAKTKNALLENPERYELYVYEQLVKAGIIFAKPKVEVFPFTESARPPWDDYGQIVDTTRFMIGEDPGDGAPRPLADKDKEQMDGEDAEDGTPREEIPTKYVEEVANLRVACQLWFVDCAGLSDGDSIKRLIKNVEPRHVTVVAGTEEETSHLRDHLLTSLYSATNSPSSSTSTSLRDSIVVAPKELEVIDITSHASVLELQLQESLVASLAWNKVSGAGLAFVDALISKDTNSAGKLVLTSRRKVADDVMDADPMDIDPKLDTKDALDAPVQAGMPGHPTVYVGTIMLNRMKDVVADAGMKAEYAGGALCVENAETGAVVLLKKVGAQHIVLEGALSEEYLAVQDLLYKELVIPQ